jgi:uncharacterized protein (DUF983 family)
MRELLDTENRTAPCPACGSLGIVHGFGPACAVCGSQITELEPRPGDTYLEHFHPDHPLALSAVQMQNGILGD